MVVPNPATPLRLIIQKKDKSFHNLRQTLEETTIGSAWVTCGGGKKGRGGSQTHHDNLEKGKAISPLKNKTKNLRQSDYQFPSSILSSRPL